MASLVANNIINTRADLDALAGTQAHADFLQALRGSAKRMQDSQSYPEGYGRPGYEGPSLEPIWEEVEDLSTITRFGFTKAELGV